MKGKNVSPASRKRDRQALERRRLKAMKLWKRGISQYKIAKRFKVSFEAVSNWVEAYQKNGLEGLKSQGHPGQKSQLSDSERKKLKAAVLKGPKVFGYDTDVWTLERIADVIRMTSKVKFKTTQTWRIVISLGLSSQKPTLRAKERNEAAIRRWRLKEMPKLKKMGGQASLSSGIS